MPTDDTAPVDEPMMTIRQSEYDSLQKDSVFLNALVAAGVDNWDGYEEAQAILEEAE